MSLESSTHIPENTTHTPLSIEDIVHMIVEHTPKEYNSYGLFKNKEGHSVSLISMTNCMDAEGGVYWIFQCETPECERKCSKFDNPGEFEGDDPTWGVSFMIEDGYLFYGWRTCQVDTHICQCSKKSTSIKMYQLHYCI